MSPLVSIIVPSFNQARFLSETLESVFSQDYPRIEVIVIDGGSTDASVDIIRRYEDRLAHWESEKDRGQSHAINKGFRHCKGDIVNWLCSDDVLFPSTISKIVDAFQEVPDAAAVLGHTVFTDENSEILAPYRGSYTCYDDLIRFWNGRVNIPQPAFFMRRRLLEKSDHFLNERFHHAMDYDLWCRTLAGEEVVVIDTTLATYRRHAAAKTTASDMWRVDKLAITRRYWGSKLTIKYWKYWSSCFRVHRSVYARMAWDTAHRCRLAGLRGRGFRALAGFVFWTPEKAFTKNFCSMVLSSLIGYKLFARLKAAAKGGASVEVL